MPALLKSRSFPVVVCLLWISGCSDRDLPELGYVTGTVTMDGEPLTSVCFRFHPQDGDGGRPSVGITDDDGNYELTYVGGVEGVKVGLCKVSVTTQWPEGEPPEGEYEKIPRKYYGKRSQLKETVVTGSQVFNFDLVSR